MKKLELKWDNVIILLIILVCLPILVTSIQKVVEWKMDSDRMDRQIERITNTTRIEEVMDSEDTEIIEQDEKISKEDPYWDYIQMKLIDVDFSELKKKNSDVKGWIQVSGTNINYPFVQTNNHQFYLTHDFDKSYNKAGWVFMDYRNHDTKDRNTILYAHGRVDKTMFGSLKNILSSGWLKKKSNYVVRISTPKENTLWQVFSVYHIPTTNDYLQTDFSSNEEFLQFANMLKKRSAHNFNTSVHKTDRILTLSTCYNDQEKVVLHAKLIKRTSR